MFQLTNMSNQHYLSAIHVEYDKEGFAFECVLMGFEVTAASKKFQQLNWFSLHIVSDTCRLTLTD